MERTRTNFYQDNYDQANRQVVTCGPAAKTGVKIIDKKWRFKPRSIWPFVLWGLALFAAFKIAVLPLIVGAHNFVTYANRIKQLKVQYVSMQKQVEEMKKERDNMKTLNYVENIAHKNGLLKPKEMVLEPVRKNDGIKH